MPIPSSPSASPPTRSTDFLRQRRPALPKCRNCKTEMIYLGESDHAYEFGCDRCKCGHVFSKPRDTEAAQHMAQLKRRAEVEARLMARERRTRYFILGGK